MDRHVILLAAGLCAGAMNAMAGGGSFVTLPTLIALGVPSVRANASSTIALFPGGAASAWVYRAGLARVCGVPLRPTFLATLAGGFAGALLLLSTPSTLFDRVLPWLLLLATLAMAFGRQLGRVLRRHVRAGVGSVLTMQFVLGVYGGYFGGAVGLMMMAVWGLLEGAEIATMQAPRTLLTTAANAVAVLVFIVAGAVAWADAVTLGTGAAAGGYLGARMGRKLPPAVVRVTTIALTALVTVHFFLRGR